MPARPGFIARPRQEAALADLMQLDASVRKRRIIERRLALTRWLLARYTMHDQSDGVS